MKITRVKVESWRHIEHIEIKVPDDASLICLVGENGTGKSGILEILSRVLTHMGVAHGGESNRSNFSAEPHDVTVELNFSDQLDEIAYAADEAPYDNPNLSYVRQQLADWTGKVVYRSVSRASGEYDVREIALEGVGHPIPIGMTHGNILELINQQHLNAPFALGF